MWWNNTCEILWILNANDSLTPAFSRTTLQKKPGLDEYIHGFLEFLEAYPKILKVVL